MKLGKIWIRKRSKKRKKVTEIGVVLEFGAGEKMLDKTVTNWQSTHKMESPFNHVKTKNSLNQTQNY